MKHSVSIINYIKNNVFFVSFSFVVYKAFVFFFSVLRVFFPFSSQLNEDTLLCLSFFIPLLIFESKYTTIYIKLLNVI